MYLSLSLYKHIYIYIHTHILSHIRNQHLRIHGGFSVAFSNGPAVASSNNISFVISGVKSFAPSRGTGLRSLMPRAPPPDDFCKGRAGWKERPLLTARCRTCRRSSPKHSRFTNEGSGTCEGFPYRILDRIRWSNIFSKARCHALQRSS